MADATNSPASRKLCLTGWRPQPRILIQGGTAKMYLSDLRREHIIDLLPKGGEVAEIGVAEGTFSQEILRRCNPSKLYLVDPWEFQARDDYKHDIYGNVDDAEQQHRFEKIERLFAAQVESGQVSIHRAFSLDAAPTFRDEQLDWLYIDALHSKEAVTADLLAYKDKVKPDGFILGHDYTNHNPAQIAGFGVVEAVDAFVVEHGYSFLALTMEGFPTYVLAKNPDSEVTKQFLLRILYTAGSVIEFRDFPSKNNFKHHAVTIGEKTVVYYSF